MSQFIKCAWMTTAVLGSFLFAETVFAKSSVPINRSNLSNQSYSGTATRAFGRNISTTRSTARNYPSARFGRSVSFNMSGSPQSSGIVSRAQPSMGNMVTRSRQFAPSSNVVRSAPVMSAPIVYSRVMSAPVMSAPRVISSTPVIVGAPQPVAEVQQAIRYGGTVRRQ